MIKHSIEVEKPIILFDGVCNYCTGIINFIASHDTKDHFRFSATQTEAGGKLLKAFSLEDISDKSVVLIEPGRIFLKSTAILRVYRQLNGLYPLLYGLIIVPRFIRDGVYDLIANKRYKWIGKRDTCMVPDERMKNKFIV